MVPSTVGEEWLGLLNNGHRVTAHIVNTTSATQFLYSPKNPQGGLVAPNSAWGLNWELEVKPQFGAPGQNILSTYLLSKGGYTVLSGTSMASPLVSAAYALLMQARGKLDPATLQSLLSATSKPTLWFDGTKTYNVLAPVAQQGAGLIQVDDAASATTILSVSNLAFNDTDHLVRNATFSIKNTGAHEVTYQLNHVKAATVYSSTESFVTNPAGFRLGAYPPATADSSATLGFSATTVRVPAGGSITVVVTPTPPARLDAGRLPVYGGYIAINGSNGEAFSLPYAGVATSMRSVPVLYQPDDSMTFLGTWDEFGIYPAPANTTFTIPRPTGPPSDPDETPSREIGFPLAVVTRKIGSALTRLDLIPLEVATPVNTTVILGVEVVGSLRNYPIEYYPDGSPDNPFTGVLADGRVVPEGRYQFIMRALKVFRNREKAEDYDVVRLPPFILKYSS